MIVFNLNEGPHCENLTKTTNMDACLLQAGLWAFDKGHSAHRQQPGHPLDSGGLFLLGHFDGLGSFSGFSVKVPCKHLLSLYMINIYKLLSTGN